MSIAASISAKPLLPTDINARTCVSRLDEVETIANMLQGYFGDDATSHDTLDEMEGLFAELIDAAQRAQRKFEDFARYSPPEDDAF